jgi:predicted RNase H-like HicB family nuclease
MNYTTFIKLEVDDLGNSFYVSRHPELSGCLGQGSTPEESIESLEEATEMYLEALSEAGLDYPQPYVLPVDMDKIFR